MKTKNIIAAAFIILLMSACKKNILDKAPLDQFDTQTFFTGPTQAKLALMGIYSAYNDNWYQYDFMSDNNYCQDSWQGSLDFSAWQQNSSSWRATNKWTIAYQTIARANTFLENIGTVSMDASAKNAMRGEARMLRGLMYADLVHFYGDVPLVLKTLPLTEAAVARTAKQTVLDSALADFDYAASVLPNSYASTDMGRATKGAALSFKTRALLYNKNWTAAAAAAKQVMDLGVYSLFSDYGRLFTEANENNSEVIFDIQYLENSRAQPWPSFTLSFVVWPTPGVTADIIDAYYTQSGLPIGTAASGYNSQQPFVNRDPRLAATFVLPGSQFGSVIYIPASDGQLTGARPRKYANIGSDPYNAGLNFILMRYADILLMRAEALIESGNTSQEVYGLIDQVRQRTTVNMPKVEAVEGTGLSQAQLRAIVRHERRVEFAMEATRYSDMRRWEDVSTVHDVYGYVIAKLSNPASTATWQFEREKKTTRVFDASKGWLWPIPQVELQNNKNLTQNPGY